MGNFDWVGGIALAISILSGLFGYLRRPALVPSSRIEEMRERIATLTTENQRLAARVSFLESRVEVLMSEAHFWQEEYRKLRASRVGE